MYKREIVPDINKVPDIQILYDHGWEIEGIRAMLIKNYRMTPKKAKEQTNTILVF